jgi:hypothetical protein
MYRLIAWMASVRIPIRMTSRWRGTGKWAIYAVHQSDRVWNETILELLQAQRALPMVIVVLVHPHNRNCGFQVFSWGTHDVDTPGYRPD